MSNGEIVAVEWRSAGRSVCFVAVQYEHYWQAYVTAAKEQLFVAGFFMPEDPAMTERYCADEGAKLSWNEAAVFFPGLDITQYKTYPKGNNL